MRKIGIICAFFLLSLHSIGGKLLAEPVDAVASVNGVPITAKIFEKRMRRLTGEGQGTFDSFEGKKELLDLLIVREVLNQNGRDLGFDKSAMVKERVSELVENIVVDEMVNYIIREKVTEPAMSEYYRKNKADFREVRANHILLKTEAEAKAIKEKLDKGADFGSLAKEVSTDPASAARGGDLGFFNKDRMVEAFAEVAFAMKKNEIVGPVKSALGYHIIQLVDQRDPVAFESLTPAQRQNLRGTMINWEIDNLREKAKVIIDEARLKQAASASGEHRQERVESNPH